MIWVEVLGWWICAGLALRKRRAASSTLKPEDPPSGQFKAGGIRISGLRNSLGFFDFKAPGHPGSEPRTLPRKCAKIKFLTPEGLSV